MERMLKKVFCFAALLSTGAASAVAPYLSYRGQGYYSNKELAGWAHHVNLADMDNIYGSFAVMGGYSRSFREKKIAECLFGEALQASSTNSTTKNSGCQTVKVSGSNVTGRDGTKELLADYLYLPDTFTSELVFKPRISNGWVNFDFYLGLDEWAQGLYFRIHAPLVHTRWNLNFTENNPLVGASTGHIQGYFNGATTTPGLPVASLLTTAADYFSGKTITDVNAANASDIVTFQALKFAKFDKDCKSRTETKLADLEVALGWNFLLDMDYHLGLNIRFSAPTGNKPKGEFLFEPIVGNGDHFGFGGGLTSHYTFWRSDDEDNSFGIYIDANLLHFFKTRQKRTFDLKNNGALSRYMLALKMDGTVENNLGQEGTTIVPVSVFNNEMAPVANISTADVNVSVGVQGDVTAMFNLAWGGFNWDIGYNFWGRSCEKIKLKCDPFAENTWTLKGDSHVYGFETGTNDTPTPLAVSQSKATAFKGLNRNTPGTLTDAQSANPRVDNPQLAEDITNNSNIDIATGTVVQTNISIQPIFLDPSDCGDLDFEGARTKGTTHGIFTHLSYNWIDMEDWVPYLGIGGGAEFGRGGNSSSCDSSSSCSSCQNCSLSQWHVWAKLGVSFN